MKRLLLGLCLTLLCISVSPAADLTISDTKLIAQAGIPLYSKATFVYGNKGVGFRFATSETLDGVRQWYQQQVPAWSLFDKFGSWALYDGKPGAGMGALMSHNRVQIQKNDKLPEWHKVDESMTTEIVIMVVK